MTSLHESLPPPAAGEATPWSEDGRLREAGEDEEVEAEQERGGEGVHGDHHHLACPAAGGDRRVICHNNVTAMNRLGECKPHLRCPYS